MTIRKRIAALLRRTADWIDRHDRERAFNAHMERTHKAYIERMNAQAEDCIPFLPWEE
jgi:hypothetical protein